MMLLHWSKNCYVILFSRGIDYNWNCFFFRRSDAELIANYRVQTELSAIESTNDGKAIVLGTVDGCLSVLAIADPAKENVKQFLESLPSRDQHVGFQVDSLLLELL